jgi:hypothetical protein
MRKGGGGGAAAAAGGGGGTCRAALLEPISRIRAVFCTSIRA